MKPRPSTIPLPPGRCRVVELMLRLLGVSSMLALVAVIIPHEWMDHGHRTLGLGELPNLPIVSYLSRSLSGFYAWLGAIVIFLSFDVEGHRRLIRFFAWSGLIVAVVQTGIDFAASLPLWWTFSEGGFLFAFFGTLTWLTRR